jgi:hypothetical protein
MQQAFIAPTRYSMRLGKECEIYRSCQKNRCSTLRS